MEKIEVLQLAVDSNMSVKGVEDCGVKVGNSDEYNIANLRHHAARYKEAMETNRQRSEAFTDKADKMEAANDE